MKIIKPEKPIAIKGNSEVISMWNDSIKESNSIFDLTKYEPPTKHKIITIPKQAIATLFFLNIFQLIDQ